MDDMNDPVEWTYVKGFTREQDIILSATIDVIIRNASREELVAFFLKKFKGYSQCSAAFAVEVLQPLPFAKKKKWRVGGLAQEGVHEKRWSNFCEYLPAIQEDDNWFAEFVKEKKDRVLMSKYWSDSESEIRLFDDIQRLVDKEKSSWISVLYLPSPSVHYPYRFVFVTYSAKSDGSSFPNSGEQDWRLLLFFKQLYELSVFDVRRDASLIQKQKKLILQDLAPSIMHHEITSRIVNSERTLELLEDEISNLDVPNKDFLLELVSKTLLKDIRNIRKINHSVMGLNRRAGLSWLSLKDELEMVRDLVGFRIRKYGGRLSIDCDDEVSIYTDSALLMHVTVNLANNAVDAVINKSENLKSSQTEGYVPTVKLKAYMSDYVDEYDDACKKINIEVFDNGFGIEPDVIDRIFDLGVTSKSGGHGLGLSISKMVAGFLGGEIQVDSRGEYGGATLRIVLPIESPPLVDLQSELEDIG